MGNTPRRLTGLGYDASLVNPHIYAQQLGGLNNLQKYNDNFGCSLEAIYSPVQIKKAMRDVSTAVPSMREIGVNGSEMGNFGSRTYTAGEGGVSPTSEDLDPYFFNNFDQDGSYMIDKSDINTVVNVSDGDPDLSVRKSKNINEVRTLGLRGPLLLSSWGFDIGDKPVPSFEEKGDGSFVFPGELSDDRSNWKTGPVHLLWDDERQVWAGGLPMLMGVATSDIEAPEDPITPTIFTMEVLRRGDGNPYWDDTPFVTMPGGTPESVTLSNFDPSVGQKLITKDREGDHDWEENPSLVWVLAIKMNYTWIPFYIGCPPECTEPAHCVALYKDDPVYAGRPGVDDAANWECDDGECVFTESNANGNGNGNGNGTLATTS